MINRLNLAADLACDSLAATGDGRGSNISEALKVTSKMRLIDAARMAH
jgi:hypothetical protein